MGLTHRFVLTVLPISSFQSSLDNGTEISRQDSGSSVSSGGNACYESGCHVSAEPNQVPDAYGFMNGGVIRRISAAKMTAWGNSNAASVNSRFWAKNISVIRTRGIVLTEFWTKVDEAIGTGYHPFDHWEDANVRRT